MRKQATTETRTPINWDIFLGETLPAIAAALTSERLKLLAGKEPSTDRLRSHAHPEICVVLRGDVRVVTSEESLRLRRGNVLLIAPHMYHHWAAMGQHAEALWLGASPRHMGGSIARANHGGQVHTLGGLDFLDFDPGNRVMTQIIEEAAARKKGWLRVCQGLLANLSIFAWRRLGAGGRPLPPEEDYSAAEVITSNARAYIQRNFAEELTLTRVAHHVALSPNYLAGLFKKQFGRTIIEYLTEVRIEEAKRLLGKTDMKVSQVATQVGYHSSYYFSRAFKKVTRRSPMEFRLRQEG